MKLIKKIQILLQKNIKIVISIILIISLSSIIFYLDLFDLNFFNKQDILDLKNELLENKDKEDLNLEKKEDLNLEKTSNNKNLYKYVIAASCIVLFMLIIYYSDDSGDNQSFMDNIPFNDNNELNDLLKPIEPKVSLEKAVDKVISSDKRPLNAGFQFHLCDQFEEITKKK